MASPVYNQNGGDMEVVSHGQYHSVVDHNNVNNSPDHNQINNSTDHSDTSDQGEQSRYLSQLTRGRAANFFINGDVFFPARKVVYNPKHFRDFTHYMDYLTDKLDPRFGAVRKICTPHHGHRIRELRDLHENGLYVVAGKEKFKPYQYEQIQTQDKKRSQPLNYSTEPLYQSRQYVTSGRIKKCETQSILIKVWPNGGDLKGPRRVLLTPRVRPFTLPNVITHVNEILKQDCLGTVERLYFLTGTQVSDVDQISHNGQYVACRRSERFKRARYNEQGVKNLSTSPRPQRKLLAQLFPRSSDSINQSLTDQSNPSTQSSVASNSHRLRAPRGDEPVFHGKPLKQIRSPDRSSTNDLDRDQGGIYNAKPNNRTTQGARHVPDSRDSKTYMPRDQWETKVKSKTKDFDQRNSRSRDRPDMKGNDRRAQQTGDRRTNSFTPQRKQDADRTLKQSKTFSSHDRLVEEDNAATKIQAAYRGHQTRKDLKSPKPYKAPTQSKPFSSGDKLIETDNAATKIQAAYRGHQTRKDLKSPKPYKSPIQNKPYSPNGKLAKEDSAASKIQAAYRGHQTRKDLRSPKQNKELAAPRQSISHFSGEELKGADHAAATIQAAYRGHQARKKFNSNQDHSNGSRDESQKNRAAAKIQAGYRGYQTRKKSGFQQGSAEEQKAAAKIQAGFRGYQTRHRAADERSAATKIQSSFRGYLSRKNMSPGKQTARDNDDDEKVNAENKAAAKIQAGFRGYLSRKQSSRKRPVPDRQDSYDGLEKENDAAVTIQSHYRGYRARQQCAEQQETAVPSDNYWP